MKYSPVSPSPPAFWCVLLLSLLPSLARGTSIRGTSTSQTKTRNERPVIGILSQPNSAKVEHYIAASYVKWLESAGARSIPIPYDASDDTVEEIFHQINGILFPGGGATNLNPTIRKAWALAKEANDSGDYFPVWATCLGYEYLIELEGSLGEDTLQNGFDSWNMSLPLHFTDEADSSRIFADEAVRTIASSQSVTMNNHQSGIEPQRFFDDERLTSMFKVLSTNVDRTGRPFVSSIEAHDYPFYGVQFHPEKSPFEYGCYNGTNLPFEGIDHSPEAIHVSLHLANFFVAEARENGHVYKDVTKFPLVFTYEMKRGIAFQERFVTWEKQDEKQEEEDAVATVRSTSNDKNENENESRSRGSGGTARPSSWIRRFIQFIVGFVEGTLSGFASYFQRRISPF